VELAARRYPRLTWVVANADRTLPYPDEAFDFVLSVAARRNGPEIRRVLSGEGRALFVVPAEDDLIEVRRALLGRGDRRDRSAAAIDALSPHLELVERRAWKRRASLGARDVADLLASTYRGARFSQRDRAGEIAPLDVTLSRELLLFRRIRGAVSRLRITGRAFP
ncbi:MAG TPA: SAM-dependent methyltransferase, partial [Thermoanaerobaculia bacterium]